jgi:hypothetical protein
MNEETYRGTGRTTRAMLAAKQGAIYIWCNDRLNYPKDLTKKHGRGDLKVVGPSWLTDNAWRGLKLPEIVLDHDAKLTEPQWCCYHAALAMVRE